MSSEGLSNQFISYHADHMDSVGLNSLNVIENHLKTRDELHFRYTLVDLLIYEEISIRVINVDGAIVYDQLIPDASINAAQINVESWLLATYIVELISKQTTTLKKTISINMQEASQSVPVTLLN